MSRRLAHRPRYRSLQHSMQPGLHSRQNFFRLRWSYRNRTPIYEKHAPGHSLSLIPLKHRLAQYIILNHVL